MGLFLSYELHAAEGLARLFFSASEREQLEHVERRSQAEIDAIKAKSEVKAAIPVWLQVNGLVIREGHDNAVWINGQQDLQQAGVQIDAQNPDGVSIPIQLIDTQIQIQLKPGQRLNTQSGEVLENFQNTNE